MVTLAPRLSDIRPLVDATLADALARRASDIHLEPTAGGYELRFRVDGVLERVDQLDSGQGRAFVTRLMVMARLLTYRLDVPQEGRVPLENPRIDLRLAIMPTVHGLRAAVRMPADQMQAGKLSDLGLPPAALAGILKFASADAGMLIFTGPAGSGKTTTIYALLRHIALAQPGVSIIALEDPVECHLAGVTQIEVSPFGQLTYEKALRSILRQDPQILALGEIRDAATASLAVQAALSGHRLITTLHAGTPAAAVARLLEMGIEPYQLTSSIFGVVSQRLARRKTDGGYRGRVPLAEFVGIDGAMRKLILGRGDAETLRGAYQGQAGFVSLGEVGRNLVEQGVTDEAAVSRVLGGG